METRRLRRIKPQPIPVRRPLWLRGNQAQSRRQNEREEIDEMLAVLARERFCRLPLVARRAGWAVTLLCALFWGVVAEAVRIPLNLRVAWTVLLSLISGIVLTRFMVSQRQVDTLRQLTGSDELSAIKLLAASLNWPERSLRNAASVALTRLLPRLQATDAPLLDATTRSCLYRQLGRPRILQQQDLALAILKALEQVGDRHTLPHIQPLASPSVRTAPQQRLKLAAQECLSRINARLDSENSASIPVAHADDAEPREIPLHSIPYRNEEAQSTPLHAGLVGETERHEG